MNMLTYQYIYQTGQYKYCFSLQHYQLYGRIFVMTVD